MSDQLPLLIIGLDDLCKTQVASLAGKNLILERPYDMEKLIEELLSPIPAMIFCGPSPEGLSLSEVAQGLRLSYQTTPIYYVTSIRVGFDRNLLKKNGFSDAFLLPAETVLFSQVVKEEFANQSKGLIRSFRSVRLVDVTPGTELPFDTYVFLPANQKHIKVAQKGDPIDLERLTRLKKHQINSVEITSDQIKSFYEFSAAQLKKLGSNLAISETERKERMQSAVRDLISGMFNDTTSTSTTAGKGVANDCQEIVKAYVMEEGSEKNRWYEKVLNLTGSGTNTYSHASNVATLAALFSMGTGVGKPEELAMAGILHDIGLTDLPPEIQMKSEEEFNPVEKKIYEGHVELSLKIIRERKLILPEVILKVIQLHHERLDGSGFPNAISDKRLIPEAQILALSDEFDRLTATRDGRPNISPLQAIQVIKEDCFRNPAMPKFDPNIIQKLVALFASESSEAVA